MRSQRTKPIKIFYSYARSDMQLRNELEKHLSILRRQGFIREWNDRDIHAGTDWMLATNTHLNTASVILLLISPDFLASDYCYSIEMQRALERHNAGDALVIPIILRPFDWEGAPFANLQCLPRGTKPITLWKNRDEAFRDVAQGIRVVVEYMHDTSKNMSELSLALENNGEWLGKMYEEIRAKSRETRLVERGSPPNSSKLVAMLRETLASLSPEKLLETKAATANSGAGRKLLEDISKLIERFESYFDEIAATLADAESKREEFFPSYVYIFQESTYQVLRNSVLIANRKLITISNEMRSIYRNIDKKFVLSPSTKQSIDRITGICAQISLMEDLLIIGLVERRGAFHKKPLLQRREWIEPGDDFVKYGKRFDYEFGGDEVFDDYHVALIELNNYRISLREVIEEMEQST